MFVNVIILNLYGFLMTLLVQNACHDNNLPEPWFSIKETILSIDILSLVLEYRLQ